MALKQFYTDEAQIPTELKDAYVLKDGKYELQVEGVKTSIAAILDKNAELLGQHTTDKAEIDRLNNKAAELNGNISELQGNLTKAQANAIPTGFVAVAKEDAELVEKVKKMDVPLEELPNLKAENDQFKQEKAEAEAVKLRSAAATALGYNAEAFAPLAKDLDVIAEGEGESKKFFVNVKNGEQTEKKELTKEYIESLETFKPFIPSLTAKPKQGNGYDPPPATQGQDLEADKVAQGAQARSVHHHF